MKDITEQKMIFTEILNGDQSALMNDCERYGIMSGCDEYCPVLETGKCEHWKSVEDYLTKTK